jgi:hypothetical protein
MDVFAIIPAQPSARVYKASLVVTAGAKAWEHCKGSENRPAPDANRSVEARSFIPTLSELWPFLRTPLVPIPRAHKQSFPLVSPAILLGFL